MRPRESIRLGGFKILKGLSGLSVQCNSGEIVPFLLYLRKLTREKINLPYLTFSRHRDQVAFHVLADTGTTPWPLSMRDLFGRCKGEKNKDITVLSVFPHRSDPAVLARLINIITTQEVAVQGFASSPSAISVSLHRKSLEKISYALFGPFLFSSYRTPSDWKLAQKGKEQLFKEVVASYKEKRPKIYGLECWQGATILHMLLDEDSLQCLEIAGSMLARSGARLLLITMIPLAESGKYLAAFCFSRISEQNASTLYAEGFSQLGRFRNDQAMVLSLTGPHFGDRYGLALQLIEALEEEKINALSLGCTVASMCLAVSQDQGARAISAITARFDTPAIVEKK